MDPLEADDPRVIGDFRLQARLGAGGMGRVYLGFSPAGRAVAIKVIHPHLASDPAFAVRFRREVAAAQAVNAVYAVPVVAAGPDDQPPWLATAFVPAPSLQEVVATAGTLPEEAVWKLAAGLTEALRAVHASGLVHRDLKPGNVLLAADGPRLIDFGLARLSVGTKLTTTGAVLGTPSYMSPEQARGAPVEASSDIFSLGGVVYFAATGQPPFGVGAPAAMLYKIVFDEPALDGVSPRLRSLVASCLAKDPAARPTPAQLAIALMPAFAPSDQSTPARLTFWPEQVDRFISGYRARLDQGGGQPPQVPNGWRPSGETTVGRQPSGEAPALGATTAGPNAVGEKHVRRTVPVAGMNRRRALAALAGALTAGIGIGGWEAAAHAGTGKPAVPAFSLPKVAPGKIAWRFNGKANMVTAAEFGKVVYAASSNSTIYALNAVNGKPIWKSTVTSDVNDNLAVIGRSLLISGANGPYALDIANGEQLWNVKSGDEPIMLVAGRVAYLGFNPRDGGAADGVTALDPGTGTILWIYQLPEDIAQPFIFALAASNGLIYAATNNGAILALSPANGGVRQKVSGFGAFSATGFTAVNGTVFAALDNGKSTVAAVDMTTGTTLWQKSLGPSLVGASLAVVGGRVFAGTLVGPLDVKQSGNLYALDAKTGNKLWSQPVVGGVGQGPYAANGRIYTTSGNVTAPVGKKGFLRFGDLQAWQADTGKKLWSFPAPGGQGGIAGVSGSRVYYGGLDGYLYSFGA